MLAQLAQIREDADHENEYVGEVRLLDVQDELAKSEVENRFSPPLRLRKG